MGDSILMTKLELCPRGQKAASFLKEEVIWFKFREALFKNKYRESPGFTHSPPPCLRGEEKAKEFQFGPGIY